MPPVSSLTVVSSGEHVSRNGKAKTMQQLYEQYRPRTFDDVVGQDKTIAKIRHLQKRGLAGRVYWITGATGTGMTTIARLIAESVADDYATTEIDGADLSLDTVREFERICRMRPIGSHATV